MQASSRPQPSAPLWASPARPPLRVAVCLHSGFATVKAKAKAKTARRIVLHRGFPDAKPQGKRHAGQRAPVRVQCSQQPGPLCTWLSLRCSQVQSGPVSSAPRFPRIRPTAPRTFHPAPSRNPPSQPAAITDGRQLRRLKARHRHPTPVDFFTVRRRCPWTPAAAS
jgi:hypothetical protein